MLILRAFLVLAALLLGQGLLAVERVPRMLVLKHIFLRDFKRK